MSKELKDIAVGDIVINIETEALAEKLDGPIIKYEVTDVKHLRLVHHMGMGNRPKDKITISIRFVNINGEIIEYSNLNANGFRIVNNQ